jgi:hypothetical protein
MYQDDFWNQELQNDNDNLDNEKIFEKVKRQDRGYNVVYRPALKKDGRRYNKKIDIYTSSSSGNRIRDAETGEYLDYIVGSNDEDLFFKVILATGECRSANCSHTLFYASPQHYVNHLLPMGEILNPEIISVWEKKRNARLIEINRLKNKRFGPIEVK